MPPYLFYHADCTTFMLWVQVYDATPFLEAHPGGAESILISAGMDATDEFNSIHSSKAKAMLKDYYIGDLASSSSSDASRAVADVKAVIVPNGVAKTVVSVTADATANGTAAAAAVVTTSSSSLVALDPRKKQAFALIEKVELSHNVRRFRFGLQSPEHRFGLPCGKHVFIYASIGGETVMRAYTPTSQDSDLGYFDLVIKVYR
jgi:nitrate reductase (NAD(P)H)